MTREELKKHCQKQIEGCEMWAKYKCEEPHGKIYEEHKLILELLEQEPKTGHWIDNNNGTISCSYCHTWFNKDDRYSYMYYCPNCGAKMNEPRERSDKE